MQFIATVIVLSMDVLVWIPALLVAALSSRWLHVGMGIVAASFGAMLIKYPAARDMAERLAIPAPDASLGLSIVVAISLIAGAGYGLKALVRRR